MNNQMEVNIPCSIWDSRITASVLQRWVLTLTSSLIMFWDCLSRCKSVVPKSRRSFACVPSWFWHIVFQSFGWMIYCCSWFRLWSSNVAMEKNHTFQESFTVYRWFRNLNSKDFFKFPVSYGVLPEAPEGIGICWLHPLVLFMLFTTSHNSSHQVLSNVKSVDLGIHHFLRSFWILSW